MASQDQNMFFIITEKPDSYGSIHPGCLCYIPEYRYMRSLKKPDTPTTLTVICMGSVTDRHIKVSDMESVSEQEAELLQALGDDAERLKWFRERQALTMAVTLVVNTPVTVDEGGEKLRGIVRYIGKLKEPTSPSPLSGVFFGIELQGEDKGKGQTDGTYKFRRFFSCKKDCGIFAPFSRVRPEVPWSMVLPQPSLQAETDQLSIGDRVTFFRDDDCGHGMVLDLKEKDGHQAVCISTDTDENGKRGGEVEIPLACVIKGDLQPAESEHMDTDISLELYLDDHHSDLGVNSLVEVSLGVGLSYGTIRWIGPMTDGEGIMAGLELEDDEGVSDGTFKSERFFSCPPRRAMFVKLLSCRPDSRFQNASANLGDKFKTTEVAERETAHSRGKLEPFAPIKTEQVNQVLIGRMKGIQGHYNSCYMDAALFSLFSCSSVLDSILFKSTEPRDAPIQNILLHDIVNPLRSQGFVEGCHIMKLRQQMQKHGYSHSFTTDEKDPEEFLIVIMHHILALEPLLKLSAGGKVQDSYCYQIFLDQNHSLVLPTVQQLLEHSFHSSGLKLAEVPSCLILQMPRYGKKFKMFDKIIPSLELDITDLLSEGPHPCMMCGRLAREECTDCFKDPIFSQTGVKLFCKTCSSQVHSHPQRQSHRPTALEIPEGDAGRSLTHFLARDKLELFAVLCIETSHYVSFIKHGPKNEDWIFFDSMADREGESDGFNIPEVQACPEVGIYLDMSPAELANQVPRDMKGVAKRLFCDAYMYLYQSSSTCLYR